MNGKFALSINFLQLIFGLFIWSSVQHSGLNAQAQQADSTAFRGVILSDSSLIPGGKVKEFSLDGVVLSDDRFLRWDQIDSVTDLEEKKDSFQKMFKQVAPLWKRVHFRLKVGHPLQIHQDLSKLEKIYSVNRSEQALVLHFVLSRYSLVDLKMNQAIRSQINFFQDLSSSGQDDLDSILRRWLSTDPQSKNSWQNRLPGGKWNSGFYPQKSLRMDFGLPVLWLDQKQAVEFCNEIENSTVWNSNSSLAKESAAVYFGSAAVGTGDPDWMQKALRRLKGVHGQGKERNSASADAGSSDSDGLVFDSEQILVKALETCLLWKKDPKKAVDSISVPGTKQLRDYRKDATELVAAMWIGQTLTQSGRVEVQDRGRLYLMAAAFSCQSNWAQPQACCLAIVANNHQKQARMQMWELIRKRFPNSYAARSQRTQIRNGN